MRTSLLLAGALGLAAFAWQPGLAGIGVDRAKFDEAVRAATRGQSLAFPAGLVGRAAVEKFKALSPDARAAVVREALTGAKALVSTPAFAKAHDAWLAAERNAVNHGGAVKPPTASGTQDMMAMAGAQIVESVRKVEDKRALKMFLDMDLRGGDSKLKQIAPLLDSNPAEFRKQYSLWKSAKLGGPATEAEYQAALQKAGVFKNQQESAQQQRRWDELNLKAVLRKELDHFIATAATVDFAAQTRQAGRSVRFVNPGYEQKPWDWKLMYRAGRAPVQAALDVARAWRKEL